MTSTATHYRYGLYPQQVQGIDKRQRPFYFRERHGHWTLEVGPISADPDYLAWAEQGNEIAHGDWMPEPDEIDQLITKHLGAGWVQVA
ncbi:hypothetical protein KL953_35230 [Mycolicibacterium goodii]|uniref:hypothetical protein n=1 Tax=Mycolicibacterium goodii TaxID=134601 RepID=UPI001BDD8424|nr:hypothetical protein [Mycolicibacterium goodii]MBU8814115.1 hypothetical protein [Mycolicibacterium goodii]